MDQARFQTPSPANPAPPPRVILLDDDPTILEILTEALRGLGLAVSPVSTADDALMSMGEAPTPSVLITDVDLGPGPDGFAVAEHARIRWPDMPIFVMSGHDHGESTLESALRLRVVAKPLRIAALLTAVADSLSQRYGQ